VHLGGDRGRWWQVFVGSSAGNVYELDESTGAQKSVDIAGTAVSAGGDTMAWPRQNHLLVPVGNDLVAY